MLYGLNAIAHETQVMIAKPEEQTKNKQLVTNILNALALQLRTELLIMWNLGRPPIVPNTYTGCVIAVTS